MKYCIRRKRVWKGKRSVSLNVCLQYFCCTFTPALRFLLIFISSVFRPILISSGFVSCAFGAVMRMKFITNRIHVCRRETVWEVSVSTDTGGAGSEVMA